MSFEDELKQLISDATTAQEQRDKARADFRAAWNDVKLNIVKPVLDQAVKALDSHAQFSASVALHNGSIRLKLKAKFPDPKQATTYELGFSSMEETQTIECTYLTPKVVIESFTLDKFDQQTVESKVKEFLSAALA